MISIIIPAYNSGRYLQLTLQSIFGQSIGDWEILLCDDGSNPPLLDIAKEFKNPKLKYFYKSNSGVSDTRNYGTVQAKGEYIVFFDSDDIMSPDFLKARLSALEKYPQISFACSNSIAIDVDGNKMDKVFTPVCDDMEKELLIYHPPYSEHLSCPSNYMFRRKVVDQVEFDRTLSSSADRLFLLEIHQNHIGFNCGNEGILYYRVSPISMSGKKDLKYFLDNKSYFFKVRKLKHNISKETYKCFSFGHGKLLAFGFLKHLRLIWGTVFLWITFRSNPLYYIKKLLGKGARNSPLKLTSI